MRTLIILYAFALAMLLMIACGGSKKERRHPKNVEPVLNQVELSSKGIGEVTQVRLPDTLDQKLISTGLAVYEVKCMPCHKLNDETVLGPGWAGLTNRRQPEWIMNMITNVDVMLDEDPIAQKLLEQCKTRMPDQLVSLEEARALLEFIRANDLKETGVMDGAVH